MCGSVWQAKMEVAKPVFQAQPRSFNEAASVQDAELGSILCAYQRQNIASMGPASCTQTTASMFLPMVPENKSNPQHHSAPSALGGSLHATDKGHKYHRFVHAGRHVEAYLQVNRYSTVKDCPHQQSTEGQQDQYLSYVREHSESIPERCHMLIHVLFKMRLPAMAYVLQHVFTNGRTFTLTNTA